MFFVFKISVFLVFCFVLIIELRIWFLFEIVVKIDKGNLILLFLFFGGILINICLFVLCKIYIVKVVEVVEIDVLIIVCILLLVIFLIFWVNDKLLELNV